MGSVRHEITPPRVLGVMMIVSGVALVRLF